jgi:F-type H+-transporting ATPase subunit b
MKKIVLLFIALTTSVFASEHGGETDIIPRTVNFLIFAGLVYYLLADKIKVFFTERAENVVAELDKIEDKIRESKRAKEMAENAITEAEIKAKEIVETSGIEAELLTERIELNCQDDLLNMEKSKNETMGVEKNKMVRTVVFETLDDIFDGNDDTIDNQKLVISLLKKVA